MLTCRFGSRAALASLGLSLSSGFGCARVRPQADYDRTGGLIRDRLGVSEVFDPAAESLVQDRVSELLRDGLTEDEAVRVGLLNNKGFQGLFMTIGASRADVVQSSLLTNPSLFFSARFPEGGGRSDLTYTFGQEIVDLWQIPVRKRIATAQLEQAILDVLRQGNDLATDIRSRYYQLAALESSVRIAAENLDLVRQSLGLAERRLAAGESGQLDVNLLRASVLEVRTQQIGLARDLEVARAGLARSLGLSRWPEPWHLSESPATSKFVLPGDLDLVFDALRARPDACAAAQRVKAADGELRRQYLSIFSRIEVGMEGERLERRALPGRKIPVDTARASIRQGRLTAPDIETKGQRDLARRQIIDSILGPSVALTLPIWDQNQAQIAKASYKANQARKDYEDLLDEIARQVVQAAVALRAAETLHGFFEEQALPQARQNLDLARRSYEAGEQGILALIQAQQALISQRVAAVNVQRDYRIAAAELGRAVGGRLPAPTTTSAPAEGTTTQPAQDSRVQRRSGETQP